MALRAKVGQALTSLPSASQTSPHGDATPPGATDYPVARSSFVAAELHRTLSASNSSPVESKFLASAPAMKSASMDSVSAFGGASAWYLEVTPEAAAAGGGTAGHYLRVVGEGFRCLLAGLHAPAQRIVVSPRLRRVAVGVCDARCGQAGFAVPCAGLHRSKADPIGEGTKVGLGHLKALHDQQGRWSVMSAFVELFALRVLVSCR